MPANRLQTRIRKSVSTLVAPGMYLVHKYNQYKRQQQENNKKKVSEKELLNLNHKIDKLLAKIDENDSEAAIPHEEECVVCLCAKATMQTFPCGHKVVCRKCFVKTIQVAVAQRCLPLKCVVCRTRILKLKQSGEEGSTPPISRGTHGSVSPRTSTGANLLARLFNGRHTQQTQQPQQTNGGDSSSNANSQHPLPASPSPLTGSRSRSEHKRHHSGHSSLQRNQAVVSTKLMQPWLIYPQISSPKQQRAFLSDVYASESAYSHGSRAKNDASSFLPHTSGPYSPAQRRPKHQCNPRVSSRIAELKHGHMLSPRVPRCSQCIQQEQAAHISADTAAD